MKSKWRLTKNIREYAPSTFRFLALIFLLSLPFGKSFKYNDRISIGDKLGYNDSTFWAMVHSKKQVSELAAENKRLKEENQKLREEVEELRAKLAQMQK